jgi:uncharacterized protein (DUF427 family)
MKATWQGTTVAESDDTIVVEGNHYFPLTRFGVSAFAKATSTAIARGKVMRATMTLQSAAQ